jgi:hypothetical protein
VIAIRSVEPSINITEAFIPRVAQCSCTPFF